jgi:ribonuclease HI
MLELPGRWLEGNAIKDTQVADAVILSTDGSANNSTGEGGWAAIVRQDLTVREISGYESPTTSNRMELRAAIEGLMCLTTPSVVELYSDSAYMINTLKNEWYKAWFANPHVKRPNIDLWEQLVGLIQFHDVTLYKVKGHSGDYWNERADKLACRSRIGRLSIDLILPNFYDPKGIDAVAV